jgi:integrase
LADLARSGTSRGSGAHARYDGALQDWSARMAAGYTLKELMEFMGHSDLQMVQRYTKLLPQPRNLTRRSG